MAAAGSFTASDMNLLLGGDGSAGFPGVLDEIRIYARALSATELNTDMSATASLKITSASPLDGAVGVRNTPVAVTFNAPVATESLTAEVIALETLGGTVVPASLSDDSVLRRVTIAPSGPLAPMTGYRVRVIGGEYGVRSDTSAVMIGEHTWTFTSATAQGLVGSGTFGEGAGNTTADVSGNTNTGSHGVYLGCREVRQRVGV